MLKQFHIRRIALPCSRPCRSPFLSSPGHVDIDLREGGWGDGVEMRLARHTARHALQFSLRRLNGLIGRWIDDADGEQNIGVVALLASGDH